MSGWTFDERFKAWAERESMTLVTANNTLEVVTSKDMEAAFLGGIAAAPDLLEAARYARALIEAGLALQVLDPVQRHAHPDGDFSLRWAEALEQLTTAIKRAEGGDEQ